MRQHTEYYQYCIPLKDHMFYSKNYKECYVLSILTYVMTTIVELSHSTSPDTVRHLKSNSLYETVSQFDQNTCNGQLIYYSSNPSEISALKTGCTSNQPVAGNSIMLEVVFAFSGKRTV